MTYVILHPTIGYLFWSKDDKWRPIKKAKKFRHLVKATTRAYTVGGRVECIKK